MNRIISLFLFIFVANCLNAQYNSPIKNKVTLGVQTTADGLIWRGVAATDTVRKPSIDTMAYMVLDTTTNIIWHYKKATSNAWLRLNLLPSDTASMLTPYWRSGRFSGVLPVANGGTNTTTLTANKVLVGNGTSGVLTPSNLHWDNTNSMLGIQRTSPAYTLDVQNSIRVFSDQNLFNTTFIVESASNASFPIFQFLDKRIGGSEWNIENGRTLGNIGFYYAGTGGGSMVNFKPNGNVGIGLGLTDPQEKLHVDGNVRIAGLANAANPVAVEVDDDGKLIRASFYNLKENIHDIPYGLTEVMNFKPVVFNYIKKSYGEKRDVGFIAQDIESIIPEAVGTGPDSEIFLDRTKLIPILTKAIQEQTIIIKQLEERIKKLEER